MTIGSMSALVMMCMGVAPGADNVVPKVEVRSLDGRVVIAADQIRAYEWPTHTLTLAPQVRAKLAKSLLNDRIVSGIPFTVAIGGEVVYQGTFTSTSSSRSFATPVMVIDLQSIDARLGEDQVRIQLGYPHAAFFKGADPRGDARIRAALKAGGQLSDVHPVHTAWVEKSLREMQTIKVGMSREALLRVFKEEGGLSNRTHQRFVYRECPYFKVDVTFTPAHAEDDLRTKASNDTIKSISTPFLELSIID
jgi:hypothetical protein